MNDTEEPEDNQPEPENPQGPHACRQDPGRSGPRVHRHRSLDQGNAGFPRADRVWTVVGGADIGVVDGAGSAEVETAPPWCRWGRLVRGVTLWSSGW